MTLVTDLMASPVLTCTPEQSLEELLTILRQNQISGVPVVDADRNLVGVVSATDILRKYPGDELAALARRFREEPSWLHVRDLMTTTCCHVGEFTTVRQAAHLMASQRVHRLVVTRGYREVIGVITSLDMVQFVSRLPDTVLSKV